MTVDSNKLWKNARNATDEAESIRTLAKILSTNDGRTFILDLEPPDAELCIEILDHGLAEYKVHTSEKQAFFVALMGLTEKHARLPDSMVIKDEIDFSTPSQPHKSGGFSDIKQGHYKGTVVAAKKLRVAQSDNLDPLRRQFCREVILWNSLSHPNILKLVGILGGIGEDQFATVSEWMVHGTIMEYIGRHATDRLELLRGAAQGLKYLHDANLIHGDIKGPNILITNDTPPRACLADFGFTTMAPDPHNSAPSSLTVQGGTLAFMAPELLSPHKFGLMHASPTKEGDIYAFGLVILQVLTGKPPFPDMRPPELAYHVASGLRPEKPADAEAIGISISLWELIQKCWLGDKARRPQILEVEAGVCDAAVNWHTDMPPSGLNDQENRAEEDSDELEHVRIFQTYQSDGPTVFTNAGVSQPNDKRPVSAQPNQVGTHEEHPDLVFKHLDHNYRLPPTTRPPRIHKGFRYTIRRLFGTPPPTAA